MSLNETAYHNKTRGAKETDGWVFNRSQHTAPQYGFNKAGNTKDTSKLTSIRNLHLGFFMSKSKATVAV